MGQRNNTHIDRFRSSKLRPGETVEAHLTGWIGDAMGEGRKKQYGGEFVITNLRACFFRNGIFGEVFETIPLSQITSVETLTYMGYRVLRLHTANDELAFKTFGNKAIFEELYERLETLRRQLGETNGSTGKEESVTDKLKKLGELRDAGVVTDDEFNTKKAELLARL